MRIPRLPKDERFMMHAHLTATSATCDRGPELLLDPGRRGVGAVVVVEDRIISGGFNGSPPGEPHCGDPPEYLHCVNCGCKFVDEPYECATVRGKLMHRGRCPDCNGGTLCRKCVGGHLMRNGSCVRTLHAEENAILQCALDGVSPRGGTVYTTAGPCWDCAKRLVRVKVKRLVFAETYESRYGLSRDAMDLLRRAGVELLHLDVSTKLGL